jgi:hypothetical protein
VNIESIEVIDPSDSREPKVISAFRGDTSPPAAVAPESSAASEEE